MPVEPQPLSEDLNNNFTHPSDIYGPDWKEWETTEEQTELNPVEEK